MFEQLHHSTKLVRTEVQAMESGVLFEERPAHFSHGVPPVLYKYRVGLFLDIFHARRLSVAPRETRAIVSCSNREAHH